MQTAEQQNMPFPTMAELYLEEMQNNPPKVENIHSYKNQYSWGSRQQALGVGPDRFPKAAFLALFCRDNSYLTIVLHYEKMVGYGKVTGYSAIAKTIDSDLTTEIFNQVKAQKSIPADIRKFLPDTHPVLFTVEN